MLQLEQTKTLIVDQVTRLDQLLNVTIPAFEMAGASTPQGKSGGGFWS
jgi:hypothetical protein